MDFKASMKGQVARNTLILSFFWFLTRALVFVFFIFLARIIPVNDFGKIVFTTSLVTAFAPLADLGMERYLLIKVSRDLEKKKQIMAKFFSSRLLVAGIVYLLVVLVSLFLNLSWEDWINILFFGLVIIGNSVADFFVAFFNAQEKAIQASLVRFFPTIFWVFFGFLLLKSGNNYRSVLWSIVGSSLITAAVLIGLNYGSIRRERFSWDFLKQLVKETWPFAALTFIVVVYLKTDIIILKKIKGDEAAGWYGLAAKVVETAILIPQSFSLALFPVSARLFATDREKMKRVYFKGVLISFLVSLFIAGAGFWLTPWMVSFLFGGKYLPAVGAIRVVFLSLIFFFSNALAANVIHNSNKVSQFVPFLSSILLLKVVLAFLLISRFSLLGAAWSVVGAEFAAVFVNNYFVLKIFNSQDEE